MGLGLWIVQRTVERLGHSLTVRSRPGRGSCFAVEVPLASRVPARLETAGNKPTIRRLPEWPPLRR
jgi:K+-sensing histidine kinase KdpD